jgi:hypothetical protein
MQRVIIVDFSNLRENRPGRMRVLTRVVDGVARRITVASWRYIEEALLELAAAAPGSTICLIADKGIRYDFEEADGKDTFDAWERLPCDNFWFLYALPTRRQLAKRRGDDDAEFGVQADELILYLAAELDGFVISRDFFREDQYQMQLNKFDHRVFWPAKALNNSGWGFASSDEVRQTPAAQRLQALTSYTQLSEVIAEAPLLNAEQQRVMKESICGTGGLIVRFWLEYFERHTVKPDEKTGPTQVTDLAPSVRKIKRPRPAIRTSASTSPLDIIKEQIGIAPPSNDGVDDDRKIPVIPACHRLTLTASVGMAVRLVGRLRQDSSGHFLEWYPGDRRVSLRGELPSIPQTTRSFVGIVGRLAARGDKHELRTDQDSVVVTFGFEEVVELLDEPETLRLVTEPRRWNMPRLPSRKLRAITTTAGIYKPPRPKVPPPGPAVAPTQRVTPTELAIPPIPTPPRISARLRTVIALAVGVLTAIAALVISALR